MTLKECLEKRVSECTRKHFGVQQRISLCLCDSSDEKARRLCTAIFGDTLTGNVIGDCMQLDASIDLTQQVLEYLKKYSESLYNRELKCEQGIYFLFVSEKSDFWMNIDFAQIVTLMEKDFKMFTFECCLLQKDEQFGDWTGGLLKQRAQEKCSTQWLINEEDSFVLELLLKSAQYDRELFSAIVKKENLHSSTFGIKYMECNAVREDLSQRFLLSIEQQITRDVNTQVSSKLESILRQQQFLNEQQCSELPTHKSLPLVGLENLFLELDKELSNKTWLIKKIDKWKKKVNNTKLSVRDVLGILYGKYGNEIKAEIFRKKVETEIIPEICRLNFENNFENIKEKMESGFSVYEIIHILQNEIFMLLNEKNIAKEKIEEEIQVTLDSKFCYITQDVVGIYNGLGKYFDLFKKYRDMCLSYNWWNQIARNLLKPEGDLRKQAEAEHKKLQISKNVFENSCIPCIDQETMNFSTRAVSGEKILTQDMLIEKVQMAVSDAEFNMNDIQEIIKAIDQYFVNIGELHVKIEKKPKVFLFVEPSFLKSDMEQLISFNENSFKWKIKWSECVSASQMLPVRVYDLTGLK